MATAKKLPSGNWNIRLYVGTDASGKRQYVSFTAPTKKEVERDAAVYNADRKQGELDRKAGRVKLAKGIEEYIESCRKAGKSPATIRGYVSMQKNFDDVLNETPINEIRLRDMQAAVDRWQADGLSAKSIRNRIVLVTSVLNAYEICYNFRAIKLKDVEKKVIDMPQDKDVQTLLRHYKQASTPMYIAVLLAATLGLRRSEICALEWPDIDFKAGTLTVNKALVFDEYGVPTLKGTKSNAGTRPLKISDSVLNELKQYRQLSGRVVPLYPNRLTENYLWAKEHLGVPGSFHALRHYAISTMASIGVKEECNVRIAGHASNDAVHQHYEHAFDDDMLSAFAALNAHSDALIENI